MKVYIAWDNGGCEKIMIGTYATRKAAEKVIDRFGEIQEMEVQELMKNWSQLFSNKANEMSDARKEMMIVEHKMTYCVNCKYFEEKKEGHYWTTGCLNPRTPLRFKNYNEEVHELFRAFACPYGETVKKESVENVDTDNKN